MSIEDILPEPEDFELENDADLDITEHRFALLETLGEGAMGKVVLARDEDLLRKVAVKKIKGEVSQNQFLLDSFVTEAQITAQLEHPCIIPVYGLEINQDGDIAYSMKRIEGHTLSELIETARQQYDARGDVDDDHDLNAFLEHFLKVADAVEYAHQKGVMHRDLKPDNIMIGSYNEVYILDWGIARPMSQPPETMPEDTRVTVAKTAEDFDAFEGSDVYGTPCYMSPEQAAGGNAFLNAQSDLYSLGLILFELVSLRKAYTADPDYNQTIDNSVDGKINTLTPYHPAMPIPRELAAIIHKSTQRTRKDRYATVNHMSDEIRRYLRGEAVLAQPDSPVQALQRWISHNREKTLILILGITLLSASVIAWSFYKRHTDNIRAQQREATQVQFLNLMRDKSQQINAQFLDIAGLTQEFAAGVEQVLAAPQIDDSENTAPVYTFAMAQKGQRPPDVTTSEQYPSSVSLDHFVFKAAEGVSQEAVMPIMQKVASYAPFMKQLFLLSHGDPYLAADSPEARDLLLNKGVLSADTYAGFEVGFGFTYPMSITNAGYDARERPWYQVAKGTRGVQWGQPYFDSAGLGWVIPSTEALYTLDGTFQGVVGMDIKLPRISEQMKINRSYVKDVYLLNGKGEILIQGSAEAKNYRSGDLVNTLEQLEMFPEAEVVQAIKNKQPSGYFRAGNSRQSGSIYAYQHLSSNQWYYLVEVDAQQLFSSGEAQ